MSHSKEIFERATKIIPGGVNSPVRAFKAVGGNPLVINRGSGAYLFDADDKRYIDYVGSWGAAILGHAVPEINQAVKDAVDRGLSFGTLTAAEVQMAEVLCHAIDSIDMVRMVNSGTEATMSAVRLARGFTGRDLMVKFEGCYHGHADTLLSGAGSGVLTLGISSSKGVPHAISAQTIVLQYNNPQQVKDAFKKYGKDIAAIIVEPIAGNMNLIPASDEFMACLDECRNDYGSVLIFDEVMSGFRVAPQGAQSLYRVRPDLTTLGKIIGGGMPVGALGGRKDIMEQLAPLGEVYQAGTLSGNPIAMAAGLQALKMLSSDGTFDALCTQTETLMSGLRAAAQTAGVPFFCRHIGAMFGIFFTTHSDINTFSQVKESDDQRFQQFFHYMLERGVYFAPSLYEAGFVSTAHSDEDIAYTVQCAQEAFVSFSPSP